MNDELTTEPNIEKIEDKNNEANQDLSKDKVTGDTSRVFLPCQIWIVNFHVINPVKKFSVMTTKQNWCFKKNGFLWLSNSHFVLKTTVFMFSLLRLYDDFLTR